MSYNLALFCTITWTIIATIHIAGALRLLSHLMEVGDFISFNVNFVVLTCT